MATAATPNARGAKPASLPLAPGPGHDRRQITRLGLPARLVEAPLVSVGELPGDPLQPVPQPQEQPPLSQVPKARNGPTPSIGKLDRRRRVAGPARRCKQRGTSRGTTALGLISP